MHSTMVRMVLLGLMCAGSIASDFGDLIGSRGMSGVACAADVLKIDDLAHDPKQFRTQVNQLISKADSLIAKLKANPNNEAVVLLKDQYDKAAGSAS